jgi:hypothetical protein
MSFIALPFPNRHRKSVQRLFSVFFKLSSSQALKCALCDFAFAVVAVMCIEKRVRLLQWLLPSQD